MIQNRKNVGFAREATSVVSKSSVEVDTDTADFTNFGSHLCHNASPYTLSKDPTKLSKQTIVSLSRASAAMSFYLAEMLLDCGELTEVTLDMTLQFRTFIYHCCLNVPGRL